jgi:hypothetical protein
MRLAFTISLGIALLSLAGCAHKPHLKLTPEEIAQLSSKENMTLSESLRKRLINDSQELHLTPEEQEVLRRTGKVILCGKCGHLLDTPSYKKWEKEHGKDYKPEDKFVPNSLRSRILEISTD